MFRTWLVCLATVLVTGCATTRVVSDWHDAEYAGPTLERFVVVGISERPGRRRYFETAFGEALAAAGVSAQPSFRQLPDAAVSAEKDAVAAALEAFEVDAVLTTRIVEVSREQRYVPPDYFFPAGFYRDHDGFFYPGHFWAYRPGYVVTDTIVVLETNLYAANGRRLLWSGSTRSFNPGSAERVVDELRDIVVTRLAEHGYIKPPPAS